MLSKGILIDVSNSLRQHGVQPKILFDALDSNRRGCLTRNDFYRMAYTYRPMIHPVEFDELFWQVNRSCSGEISFAEFCAALGFSPEPPGLEPILQDIVRRIHNSLMDLNVKPEELFRRLDLNRANMLGPSEIGRMVRSFNHQINKVEFDALYRHFSEGTNAAVDLRMFCRALGFPNNNVNAGFVPGHGDPAWQKIEKVARSLQSNGTGLQNAFLLFDSNSDGYLDRDELHRLLSTCDGNITPYESDGVFNRVAPQGMLRFLEFAKAFDISANVSENAPPLGYWMRMSPPSKLDPTLRSLASRTTSWLEPALLSQSLNLEGQSRISRARFEQLVQALEPRLGPAEIDRLFKQTGLTSSGEMEMNEFTRRFASEDAAWMAPGPGSDQWALALLRRVARRAAAALSAPQDLFKKYSITVSGELTYQEFAAMAQDQMPSMTPEEVDALWNLVDADKNGRVDLYEFSTALRFLMLEAQDTISSTSKPPALGSARDQVIEARIAQLTRSLAERSLSLAQAFALFDIQGTGFIDRLALQRLLGSVGIKLAEWEVNEIIAWFDTAGDGRINHQELVRWFDVSAQARAPADAFAKSLQGQTKEAAWKRVAELVQSCGSTLPDAFRLFDSDRDGNLDRQEFFSLMTTCDPSINQYESQDIFTRLAGDLGQLDFQKFVTGFSLSDDLFAASKANVSTSCVLPQLDQSMHSLVKSMNGWLEPALLSRSLGITNQTSLSRADFNRVVLAIEPRLSSQELDRLYLQANASGTGALDVNNLIKQFAGGAVGAAPAPGADPWAISLMRRVTQRMNLALAAPADIFRKFDVTGEGELSQMEFERMVRMQDEKLTASDIDKLWNLADRNGDGRIDLREFCNCLRHVQLEAEDTTGWGSGPPDTSGARDRMVEVRMAQLARCCTERGLSLARAFALYDPGNTGFIDRNSLQQLMMGVGLNITDWEVSEIITWGDTSQNGRLNYQELLRQFDFLFGSYTAPLQGTASPFWQHAAGVSPAKPEKPAAAQAGAEKEKKPEPSAAPPPASSRFSMVLQHKGNYTLQSDDKKSISGDYMFDPNKGEVLESYMNELVGIFSCDAVAKEPLPFDPSASAKKEIPCIMLEDSEIMAEIQKPSNNGAYFVLPSQLNGAEYPSHDKIVERMQSYMYDNTGGPRGQLAVHPAAGQFMLDNAANNARPAGINAVDKILQKTGAAGFKFQLVNGYLSVPNLQDQEERKRAAKVFMENMHDLRMLVMENIPACGLTPDKKAFVKDNKHTVTLLYASAVPVQAYLNSGVDAHQEAFQVQIAESVLVAQYYGALKLAAHRKRHATVFLMPLGGGVFKNPWTSIAKSMSVAVEMLRDEERARLDVRALTWRGNPEESRTLSSLLVSFGKLKASTPAFPKAPPHKEPAAEPSQAQAAEPFKKPAGDPPKAPAAQPPTTPAADPPKAPEAEPPKAPPAEAPKAPAAEPPKPPAAGPPKPAGDHPKTPADDLPKPPPIEPQKPAVDPPKPLPPDRPNPPPAEPPKPTGDPPKPPAAELPKIQAVHQPKAPAADPTKPVDPVKTQAVHQPKAPAAEPPKAPPAEPPKPPASDPPKPPAEPPKAPAADPPQPRATETPKPPAVESPKPPDPPKPPAVEPPKPHDPPKPPPVEVPKTPAVEPPKTPGDDAPKMPTADPPNSSEAQLSKAPGAETEPPHAPPAQTPKPSAADLSKEPATELPETIATDLSKAPAANPPKEPEAELPTAPAVHPAPAPSNGDDDAAVAALFGK